MYNNILQNNKKKGFFSILINQLLNEEPKNKEELLELIRSSEKNDLIDQTTYEMLKGVINITKKRIKDIMIPRSQMVVIKKHYSFNKCLNIIINSSHSRFPVMSHDNNYVQGFLLAKDLIPLMYKSSIQQSFCIKNIIKPSRIVPESKYVNSMLKEFKINRYHIAVVVDEFGTVSGLVTIEDILEIIVGEIFNNCDKKKKINLKKINRNTISINALTKINKINKIFNMQINNNTVDTIGGFIMQKFKYLPKVGEKITIQEYTFEVSMLNSRRITHLNITFPNNMIMQKIKESIV